MRSLIPIRRLCVLFGAVLALCVARPASAQLYEVTRSNDPSAGVGFAAGAAYDPVHDCYFIAASAATVYGHFIDRQGATIGSVTFDSRGSASLVEVAYSPDVSDGAGGFGGFVTIWSIRFEPGLFAQIVAFPVGLVGPRINIRPAHPATFDAKASIAYSPAHHVFLVAESLLWNDLPTRIIRLDLNAQPIDDVQLGVGTDASAPCGNLEFVLSCDRVVAAWNPVSSEFGVLYGDQRQITLARVSGDGAVLSRTPLRISFYWIALAVNSTTGNYLAVGSNGRSTFRGESSTAGAEVSPSGAILAQGVVTSSLDTDTSGGGIVRLSYSATSGTFLLAGSNRFVDSRTRLLELNQHGVPVGEVLLLGDFSPLIASHPTTAQWLADSFRIRFIVGTVTGFGGSDAHLSGICITPDPFVALGGGTCVNGGWYPPGMIPTACTTPDPFVGLGGGRCVNGGWYPPTVPAPPTPAPLPGGCITPDPFVAFGGGRCLNGGWNFPTKTPPTPSPPVPGGCVTPDPFVALGGGRCVNGGWYPPGTSP